MNQPKVLVYARMEPMLKELIWDKAPAEFELVELSHEADEHHVVEGLKDADFMIPLRTIIPDRALREAGRLKLIQLFSQGYDRIQIDLTSELGIPVANVGGLNSIAVAEHTLLLMLALIRRFIPSIKALEAGKWALDLDRRIYHQLHEKTVGIIGLGNIGRRVARMVHAFDARVIFRDILDIPRDVAAKYHAEPVELEELLKRSDIVTLHVPLLKENKNMIGWDALCMMKPSALLLNTSRGPVIDEAALIRALEEKQIAGAGLDVFAQEPPKADNPLLHMENVVTTPHIGGFSIENVISRVEFMWENMSRVWNGQPPKNVVSAP